jgi:putative aminopeptidase FrvX
MNDIDLDLIRTLTDLPGVSGHEDRIVGFVRHHFERSAEHVLVDGIGNVIARKTGEPDSPRVMLFAHLDQIGFCVKRLGEDGFVRIDRVGGVNRKALVAAPVWLHNDRGEAIPGSIGVMAHHLTPDAQRFTVPDIPDLYVDVGARSREELIALGLKVGDPITFANTFQLLNGRFLRAAALDDRIGVYILLKTFEALAEKELRCDVHAVATVQEEFNVRGSEPAARAIAPHLAICIDGSLSGDTPDLQGVNDIRMGGGPSMSLMTFHGRGTLGGLIPNPKLVRLFDAAASDLGIELQRGASIGGLTDASFLQLLHHGVPAIDVGVPMRYSHSPVEMVCLDDVQQAITLFTEVVSRVNNSLDLSRGIPWSA